MTNAPILVDSDVAIDFLKGKENALPILSQLFRARQAWISVLSIYEIFAGMRQGEKKRPKPLSIVAGSLLSIRRLPKERPPDTKASGGKALL